MSASARLAEAGVAAPGLQRFSPRQEEVLDVIETVFLRQGMRAIRMGQLATEAGCSRSTLYELAPSKEDLLLLVLDRMMRRISRKGAEAIAQGDSPIGQIRAMVTSAALDFSALGPRFLDAVRQHPPARMLYDRWVGDGCDALEQLIENAITAGQFQPVTAVVVAEAIFAVVLRFTDPEFTRSTKVELVAGLTEMLDVLLAGLRPRASDGR